MKIRLIEVSVKELTQGYVNNDEDGVYAYGGKLCVRPPYQREFVYKDKQRDAVIETITMGFPLGTMYWVETENGFELLDGQQRTISICQYVNGEFSIADKAFQNLLAEEQESILSYKLLVYKCSNGTDKEKLDWFRTINISGERLTDQELLNINYMGSWLEDAKRKFSKSNCVAYKLGNKYVKGSTIRQEYLETALSWISGGNVANYMSIHQHDATATELWLYFQNVISWVEDMFPNYRKEMIGINWGKLYNQYHNNRYNPTELEELVKDLMVNEEVTDKRGIYEYVLCGCDESFASKLSKRSFSVKDKRIIYERQNGVCPICGNRFVYEDMEGDHIVPWWRGGVTTIDNLQMLCRKCNIGKGGKIRL